MTMVEDREYKRCIQCGRLRKVSWFAKAKGFAKSFGCLCGSRRTKDPNHVSLWERLLLLIGVI